MTNREAQSPMASIHHDGSPRYVRGGAGGGFQLGDIVTIRLRAGLDLPLERVFLRTAPDGEQQFTEMHPEPGRPGEACAWWQASLPLHMPLTTYRFLIFSEDGAWWYNGSGAHRNLVTDHEDFRLLAGYTPPAWVKDSVFYQIFPDRFADGDPGNNVRNGEFVYREFKSIAGRWGEPPRRGSPDAMLEFFGGDLAGIERRLVYLQDLGVNALYLNPIFTAFSNHRYDVVDYFNVDPHLGGNEALVSLREATARRGMRLMLDIVPNHCGFLHPWFQRALADPDAPVGEFFTFFNHPDDYACWLGVRSLPKLNYRSPALREVMYAGHDAVLRHWLRPPYAIDAWRLDVANMLARQGADQLGVEVGRGIRQAIKAENPQAYVLGENFFDASPQLQGDLWDAAMNYSGFAKPLWYWLSRFHINQHTEPRQVVAKQPWPAGALVDSWQAFRAAIPWTIARQQFNLLGSHDTPRILSLVQGDEALNRLAVGVLMTYPGVPSVYYGDEIGLGRGGEDTRACMIWDPQAWDDELRGYYQKLIHLRRNSPALIDGGFQALLVEENAFAYLRDADQEQIVVIANRGPGAWQGGSLDVAGAAIADGTVMEEVLSGERRAVEEGRLPLPAVAPGVQIWRTV